MNGMQEGQAFAHATEGELNESNNGQAPIGAASEAGNVDKIRDILFGGQMRDYEKRFARLEERLIRESTELREENRQAVAALETFIKKELEVLTNRLQNEQQSREAVIQCVSRELHDTARTIENRLSQFDNQTTAAHRDLREQILDQSKALSDEMRRRHEDMASMLQREVADLTHQKTDRTALSSLFTEIAMRLNQDFSLPSDK